MTTRPTTTTDTMMNIPDHYLFVYLDANKQEYINIRNEFCNKTKCRENAWQSFDRAEDAEAMIKSTKMPKRIFLVSAGRLCSQIIKNVHDYPQLHSVYVYCQNIDTYASLKREYVKVREIFTDPALLVARLRNDIIEELTPISPVRSTTSSTARSITTTTMSAPQPTPLTVAERARRAAEPPKSDIRVAADDVTSSQPGKHWCPWSESNCSKSLIIKGQGSVAIMQLESAPFELKLSNREKPNDSTAFTITLTVDEKEARLETAKRTYDMSHVPHHLLQPYNGKWRQYWISLFKKTGTVRYGIGEIRSFFTIFEVKIDDDEAKNLGDIQYIHVQVGDKDHSFESFHSKRENFRFFIGAEPVIDEPPLTVSGRTTTDPKDLIEKRVLPPTSLAVPCKRLYDSILEFELEPWLCETIERSVRKETGWCRKKLIEKANRFGRPNIYATYLRLTIGKMDGTAPGHAYVVEVWPPGHFSPIHNHSNAYGVIKVLYGRVLVKLYPELALNVRQHAPLETIFEEGQITWMLPRLNQTHQVRNPEVNGKTCITIQCYQYGDEDDEHYEYFDYLNNDGQSIGNFDPKSDIDFYEFKELMKKE